jgi:hypothetical protein
MGTANYDSSRLTEMRRNKTIANYANTIQDAINSATNSAFTVRKIQQPSTTANIIAYKNEAPCACDDTFVRRSVGQICCGAATQ